MFYLVAGSVTGGGFAFQNVPSVSKAKAIDSGLLWEAAAWKMTADLRANKVQYGGSVQNCVMDSSCLNRCTGNIMQERSTGAQPLCGSDFHVQSTSKFVRCKSCP